MTKNGKREREVSNKMEREKRDDLQLDEAELDLTTDKKGKEKHEIPIATYRFPSNVG